MTAKKEIDVIIPVLNNAKYLIKTIKSINEQTYLPNNIIVVDDGSSENIKAAIKEAKSKIPTKYFRFETNKGPNAARNEALKHSTTEYIALVDSDDTWFPNKLEEQLKVFETSEVENLGVIYCGYVEMNENDEVNTKKPTPDIDPTYHGQIHKKLMTEGNKIMGSASAVLIKRKFIDEVGGFDNDLKIGEDWEMWIRLSKVCGFDYANQKLVKIRKHEGNHQSKKFYVFENEMILYSKLSENETNEDYIRGWSLYILNKISNALPNKKFLKIASHILSKTTKKKLFAAGFGNIRLYLLRLTITQYFRFFMTHVAHFFGITFKAIRNFILLLIP